MCLAVVVYAFNLIAALGKLRQADLCEFKASLVCRENASTARAIQRNQILKNETTNQQAKTKQSKCFKMEVLLSLPSAGQPQQDHQYCTVFSLEQIRVLQEAFHSNVFPTEQETQELASRLQLKDTVVKVCVRIVAHSSQLGKALCERSRCHLKL